MAVGNRIIYVIQSLYFRQRFNDIFHLAFFGAGFFLRKGAHYGKHQKEKAFYNPVHGNRF